MPHRLTKPMLALSAALVGNSAAATTQPSRLERDLSRYAMASCLAAQDQPYLKDQGVRWAGGLIQLGYGPIEAWTPITDAVTAELAVSGIGMSKPDGRFAPSVALPVMTCGHIADAPRVRAAIDAAAKTLARDYAKSDKR